MDRRRFIGNSTVSAIGLAGSSAVMPNHLGAQPRAETPSDIGEYMARVDAGMERIARWSTTEVAPEWKGDRAAADALARAAFQSLYITGMVGDLPVETQARPEVQRRLHAAIPVMDEATNLTTAFLESVTADDLARVQVALREHGAGDAIFGAFDRAAAATGLSDWRRAQMREIFAHAEWRLRNQPPGLIVDEYVDKVKKLGDSDIATEMRTRALAAQIGEAAFWEYTSEKSLHDARVSRGLRTMGYGLLILAGGGLIVAAGAFPGVFVMTAGVVTIIVGLVILLIGSMTPDRPR